MRNISSWSIKNPIPIILMFLLLTLAGVNGFMGMRINQNPDIDFPLVNVYAGRPGAAPSEMEVQVTRLIEDSLAGLSGVRHINSQITDGSSSTTIEFELGTNTERATNDVRNAMSALRADLPQDMQEPSVQRIDITGDALITWVVRSTTMTPEEISWFVDNEVSRSLLAIGGASIVCREFSPDQVFDLLERHPATLFFGVPTMFIALQEHPRWTTAPVQRLRLCVSGGAPCPAPVFQRFRERGSPHFKTGYGLTEAGPNNF